MTTTTQVGRDPFHSPLPKCKYCGGNVNFNSNLPRADQQTEEQIRAILGTATHVVSMAGPVSVDCFIEHHKPFMNYVWYERVEDRLIERPYVGDSIGSGLLYGVWPIIEAQ